MRRATIIAAVVGFGLGGLVGASAFFAWQWPGRGEVGSPPSHPKWAEVQWPHPTDEWGKGKAFRCEAADCGVEVNLYIRAKIGFCNCQTGVSDDNELGPPQRLQADGRDAGGVGAGPSHQCRVE